jgi:hypothetical protein
MATRSFIGKINHDGTITGVYCHWDGYPDGVGMTLALHYTNLQKVDQLLELGDLSSLRPRLAPTDGELHSFDSPAPDVAVAYHRDRGEAYNRPKTYAHIGEFQKNVFNDFGVDYAYLVDHRREWVTYIG